MARDNVGRGARRIHGELLKLGFVVSDVTVSRPMPRRSQPPSQTWGTVLANHLPGAAAIDFFVVPRRSFGCGFAAHMVRVAGFIGIASWDSVRRNRTRATTPREP